MRRRAFFGEAEARAFVNMLCYACYAMLCSSYRSFFLARKASFSIVALLPYCLVALWPCDLVALWPCGLVSLWPCCIVFRSTSKHDYKSKRFFDVCFDVKSIVVKRFELTKIGVGVS